MLSANDAMPNIITIHRPALASHAALAGGYLEAVNGSKANPGDIYILDWCDTIRGELRRFEGHFVDGECSELYEIVAEDVQGHKLLGRLHGDDE